MATNISPFPILNEDLLKKIRFQASTYTFYYTNDNQEQNLTIEDIEDSTIVHKLTDEKGIWSHDNYDLCITRSCSLTSSDCLFGKDGIACKNAKLGLAVVWTSADSKQRGVKKIGEFTHDHNPEKFSLNLEFNVGQLRGIVDFKTIIYLEDAGRPSSGEEFLASEEGCLLGEIDKFSIALDGIGSTFPIYEISDQSKPLWYVKCNWDDPTVDKFSESISININTAHKNYRFLDKTKKTYDEQLIREIMLSALLIIITKLKEEESYWNATTNGEGLSVGSVSEAIYYFIDTLEWDVSTIEKTSMSIKKYFNQRI